MNRFRLLFRRHGSEYGVGRRKGRPKATERDRPDCIEGMSLMTNEEL